MNSDQCLTLISMISTVILAVAQTISAHCNLRSQAREQLKRDEQMRIWQAKERETQRAYSEDDRNNARKQTITDRLLEVKRKYLEKHKGVVDEYIAKMLSLAGQVMVEHAGSSSAGVDLTVPVLERLVKQGFEANFHARTFDDSNLTKEFSKLINACGEFTKMLDESTELRDVPDELMLRMQSGAARVTKIMEGIVLKELQPLDWA